MMSDNTALDARVDDLDESAEKEIPPSQRYGRHGQKSVEFFYENIDITEITTRFDGVIKLVNSLMSAEDLAKYYKIPVKEVKIRSMWKYRIVFSAWGQTIVLESAMKFDTKIKAEIGSQEDYFSCEYMAFSDLYEAFAVKMDKEYVG